VGLIVAADKNPLERVFFFFVISPLISLFAVKFLKDIIPGETAKDVLIIVISIALSSAILFLINYWRM